MSGPIQYGIYVWDGSAFVEATPRIRHLHASNEQLSKLHVEHIGRDHDVAELAKEVRAVADNIREEFPYLAGNLDKLLKPFEGP